MAHSLQLFVPARETPSSTSRNKMSDICIGIFLIHLGEILSYTHILFLSLHREQEKVTKQNLFDSQQQEVLH